MRLVQMDEGVDLLATDRVGLLQPFNHSGNSEIWKRSEVRQTILKGTRKR